MLVNVHNKAQAPAALRSRTTCHMDQSLTSLCTVHTSWARHTGRATSRDSLFSLPRSPEQLVPPTTSPLQQRGHLLMARDNKVLGLATVSVQAAAGAAR